MPDVTTLAVPNPLNELVAMRLAAKETAARAAAARQPVKGGKGKSHLGINKGKGKDCKAKTLTKTFLARECERLTARVF